MTSESDIQSQRYVKNIVFMNIQLTDLYIEQDQSRSLA